MNRNDLTPEERAKRIEDARYQSEARHTLTMIETTIEGMAFTTQQQPVLAFLFFPLWVILIVIQWYVRWFVRLGDYIDVDKRDDKK